MSAPLPSAERGTALGRARHCPRAGSSRGPALGAAQVQSISSLVLDEYLDVIEHHLNVSAFLTMILGTGGNVGGQALVSSECLPALCWLERPAPTP